MEDAFLGKLKTAIVHKDLKLFRTLFYESQNEGKWMDLQKFGPFDTILSDSARVYRFGPPTLMTGIGGRSIRPGVSPVYHDYKWHENLEVVRELIITFPMTVPHTAGKIALMPLILKDGKLLAVTESFCES